jgi:DNA (cytosine-5)-methyltransferase 1
MSFASASAAKHHKPEFIAVDFFCGAGGTTRGLIDAGGYVIAGIDKDMRCRDTYVENNSNEKLDFSPPKFLARDIFPESAQYPGGEQDELMTELAKLIENFRIKAPEAPLMFAICAPCQPFTTLSRKEMSDGRLAKRERDSNLLSEAVKFVAKFKPELILSENVQGIRDPKYGGVWDEFRKALEALGYATGTKIICTSQFGVPQYRKRSILVAVPQSLVKDEYRATDGEIIVPGKDPANVVRTVRDTIDRMPALEAGASHAEVPNHRTRSLSETNLKRLKAGKPGASNRYLDKTPDGDLSLPCHRKVNAKLKVRCFTDVYTRMAPDRPSPTITTKCHSISNGRFGHYDVKQLRGISLREAAMLQSFPADYIFYPTHMIDPVARMIGNAVPPRLAEYFSRYLLASLGERRA